MGSALRVGSWGVGWGRNWVSEFEAMGWWFEVSGWGSWMRVEKSESGV